MRGKKRLLNLLRREALKRGLLHPGTVLDAGKVFALVRDMPYRRASDRRPETLLTEWQGTCSGKHYLLKALFAELGLPSQVMACTTITPVDPGTIPEEKWALYESANRRFVDVHNFLLVSHDGDQKMIVDATWPLAARKIGLRVNQTFELGHDQQIAADPLQTWAIPEGQDPQEFKDQLLQENFTRAELEFREEVILALGEKTAKP